MTRAIDQPSFWMGFKLTPGAAEHVEQGPEHDHERDEVDRAG